MRYNLIHFDRTQFDFIKLLQDLFGTKSLCNIHELTTENYSELFRVGYDSSTIFHQMFYDKYRAGWPEFQKLYEKLIREVISHEFEGDFLYQAWPTARFHLPKNVAVGAFHNDAEFGHPAGEINYILPLTNSEGTASVWIESKEGKGDYLPAPMSTQYLLKFNGNRLRHGNKVNETGMTRVSFDFRILPSSKYNEDTAQQSITRKTKFRIGEYFKLFIK